MYTLLAGNAFVNLYEVVKTNYNLVLSQSNAISVSWDMVKVYSIEEVSYGTWQPQLTVKQY